MRALVLDALRALGIDRFVLEIHDPAFPSAPGEDVGRGSPVSRGGLEFLEFVRDLGFGGIQFGPQGNVSDSNASPYDGMVFARNTLSIDLVRLVDDGLLDDSVRRGMVEDLPPDAERRVPHRRVHRAHHDALALAFGAHARDDRPAARERGRRLEAFRREHAAWLDLAGSREPDGLDEAAFAFAQFVAHEQHALLRESARALGLALYGDLQIGVPPADERPRRDLFLPGLRMGAPPSRTNPEGQAWDYPVLDPRLYGEPGAPGPALAFFAARVAKMVAEFDAVRVDHPHGLIDPWVYRAGAADPLEAVRAGARLFSAPDVPDVAAFAIPRPDQLDPSVARHADRRVRDLDPDQVRRYARLFDAVAGLAPEIVCEVLSTQPYPLERVLGERGLGRCRVLQKANPDDPADVYRSENAAPADWIQVGNHDTPSLPAVLDRWAAGGSIPARARYLAGRLAGPGGDREALARRLSTSRPELARATFADLFVGPARHVLVSFTDLLGYPEPYNVPGTIDPANWSLRVDPDYRRAYPAALARGDAMDVPGALALALRARGLEPELATRLDMASQGMRAGA